MSGKHKKKPHPMIEGYFGPYITKAFLCVSYRDHPTVDYVDCITEVSQSTSLLPAFLAIEFARGDAIGTRILNVFLETPETDGVYQWVENQPVPFTPGIEIMMLHVEVNVPRDRLGYWYCTVLLENGIMTRFPVLVTSGESANAELFGYQA